MEQCNDVVVESVDVLPDGPMRPFAARRVDAVQRVFHTTELPRVAPAGSWMAHSVAELGERLGHRDFPCPFGKKSHERESQWFVFVEEMDRPGLEHLRLGLKEYVALIRTTDRARDLLNPLLVMFRPQPRLDGVAAFHAQAWRMLQYLHDHDDTAWPQGIPTDPDRHLWTFCFAGMQLFVNISTPAHREYRSRNLGSGLAFVINPRENFDVVAGPNEQGRKVRAVVRERLAAYNGRPASATLGTYGDLDNREWRQYAHEEGGAAAARCPLHIRAHQP
jgi:FPC/CPF motif-containing protein YcgG